MPDGKMDIKPEDLKAQVPELEDVRMVVSRMQGYVQGAKAQANHFGNTPNGKPAGDFTRQSLDALAQSLGQAQTYMAGIIEAVKGTVGMTTQTESQNKASFKNQAV